MIAPRYSLLLVARGSRSERCRVDYVFPSVRQLTLSPAAAQSMSCSGWFGGNAARGESRCADFAAEIVEDLLARAPAAADDAQAETEDLPATVRTTFDLQLAMLKDSA